MFQKKYFNQKQPHEFYIWHNYPNRSAITLWWVFGCYNIILTLRWLFSGCELTCVRYLRVQHTLNVPCGGYFRSNNFPMIQFLGSERFNNFNMKQLLDFRKIIQFQYEIVVRFQIDNIISIGNSFQVLEYLTISI